MAESNAERINAFLENCSLTKASNLEFDLQSHTLLQLTLLKRIAVYSLGATIPTNKKCLIYYFFSGRHATRSLQSGKFESPSCGHRSPHLFLYHNNHIRDLALGSRPYALPSTLLCLIGLSHLHRVDLRHSSRACQLPRGLGHRLGD